MSIQIVQEIQKNLGYTELRKMDPNDGGIHREGSPFGNNAIAQAAIPSILCGFSDYLRNDENASQFMKGIEGANNLQIIFGDKLKELISRIADYANSSLFEAEKGMEHIASEAERILHKLFPNPDQVEELRAFFTEERHEILSYLPGSLHTGDLLHHDNLDDNTHKMEGPVSSFMHGVEKIFNE